MIAAASLSIQTPKHAEPGSASNFSQIKARYQAAGQGHLLNFYEELPSDEQERLLAQLDSLNVERVNRIHQKATTCPSPMLNNQAAQLAPLPEECFDSTMEAAPEKINEWNTIGMTQIAQNKVGVILLAGGQGTRLGSSAPKGCYDISLPSNKSLFQIQAERILKLQRLAKEIPGAADKVIIPWYVMTSGPTRPATVAFFQEHNYFGLDSDNVIFFEQ
ncbi:UDP-N-acetylglucosamine pyrophosphorylase, partial [Lunasporangiospora selenospora]